MRKRTSILWSVLFSLALGATNTLAEGYLYRYVNEKGVKVLNHTVPPEVAQRGYEILSQSGQLIKVVAPAPSDGEISQRAKERQLKGKFDTLKRRYSSVTDIESAKDRRLRSLDTNINILRSNITGINLRIDELMQQAANMERDGKKVSERLLQQMKDTKAELDIAETSLTTRLQEYENVSAKFDTDLATFIAGSKLPIDEGENSLN